MVDKELIWVSKEFSVKYKKMLDDKCIEDEKEKVLDEYLETICKKSRDDFKSSLNAIEEDAAIYKGLMLKVKQTFGKAMDESLKASYALWEKYSDELPSVEKKVATITSKIKPLAEDVNKLNDSLAKIKTYDLERFITMIEKISSIYGKEKKILDFVVNNYKDV